MITTFSHDRQPSLIIIFAVIAAVALLIVSAGVKSHLERHSHARAASEFHAARDLILSRIELAVVNQDLDFLMAVNLRYGRTADQDFQSSISTALAQTRAERAEQELRVAKILDLARHREEVRLTPDPTRPQLGDEPQPRLSVLPR